MEAETWENTEISYITFHYHQQRGQHMAGSAWPGPDVMELGKICETIHYLMHHVFVKTILSKENTETYVVLWGNPVYLQPLGSGGWEVLYHQQA